MENPTYQPRIDRIMAAKVEKGLYIQRTQSTRAAALYFETNGVPVHIAVRVLTTPNKRDMSDLLASPPSWHDVIRSAGPTFGAPIKMR